MSHVTAKVKRELGRARLTVRLPVYAPEFNPVEALWAWREQGHLANRNEELIESLVNPVLRGVGSGRPRPLHLCAFLAQARLTL